MNNAESIRLGTGFLGVEIVLDTAVFVETFEKSLNLIFRKTSQGLLETLGAKKDFLIKV